MGRLLLRALGFVWLAIAALQAARGRHVLAVAFTCAAVAHLTRTALLQWLALAVMVALVIWQAV